MSRAGAISLLLLAWGVPAYAADESACAAAITSAERRVAVPARVLGTIAAVESGRTIGGRTVPWPWSINADGAGTFYRTKQEAMAAVQALRSAGARSIDVGCMQVNLQAHPQAFASLEDAFDPGANAAYAARFLRTLYQQTGRLAAAMTAYHSRTPQFAAEYARRLLAVWPEAAAFGLGAGSGPPGRPAAPGAVGRGAPASSAGSLLEVVSVRGAAWPSPSR